MSKPPEMPKFKCLRPMRPDDPFYRRGYFVGALVLHGRPKGSSLEPPVSDAVNRGRGGGAGRLALQPPKD